MRLTGIGVLCVLCLGSLTSPAPAQNDPKIKALLDKLEASLDEGIGSFMRMHSEVTVNGETQAENIQELWIRDLEHMRMEKDDGTVLVFTPREIKALIGSTGVVLHILPEAMAELGDNRAKALQLVGVGEPSLLIDAVLEGRDALTIVSEDVIGDEECWVLKAAEESYPAWRALFSSVPEDFKLTVAQVAFGKESANFRGFYIELTGPAQLEVKTTVPEIEAGVEVTDEMLTLEPPEGATIVTWSAGKTAEQVHEEFDKANAAAEQG